MTNCIVKAATIELVFDRDYFFFVTPLCIEIVILLLATICSGLAQILKMLSDKTRFGPHNISSYVHTKYKIHIHSPGVYDDHEILFYGD